MNRIENKFKELRRRRKKAFIPFVTAGDPSFRLTEELVLAFEKAGADIIELGVPFSDPMADGPTIQAASQRALSKGATLSKILQTVRRIRRHSQIPLILMTYYNPVFHFGEEKFVAAAHTAGVDGLIIPDLPPEEAKTLMAAAKRKHLSVIFFLAPTTTKQRMKKIIKASTGFIYFVSLTGVTGARTQLSLSVLQQVRQAKKLTDKPIVVGFGISTPEQVRAIGAIADGVIVASAIINRIVANTGHRDLVKRVSRFVGQLSGALR